MSLRYVIFHLGIHPLALTLGRQLPDDFQDKYSFYFKEGSSDSMYTHCKRELMHAVWRLLLDGKFMDTYRSEIVIRCNDGIIWHIFPRFFTYSADYPEKQVLHVRVCPLMVTNTFSGFSSLVSSSLVSVCVPLFG